MLGSRVRGHYLGQPFEAQVLGVQAVTTQPDRYRLTLDFDEPVDVVTFGSFPPSANVSTAPSTKPTEQTSNGRPHVELMW